MTIPFVLITIYVMAINPMSPLIKLQKGLMLTMAVTGTTLYLQITIMKWKKKRK
jgi:hypothetical protein